MERDYLGGYFWDVLLISELNDDWYDFYFSLVKVLPCKKCREETLKYHTLSEVPKFKNQEEKNKYIWDLRLKRGGDNWRQDIEKKGYTYESWIDQFKNKPFTRIG